MVKKRKTSASTRATFDCILGIVFVDSVCQSVMCQMSLSKGWVVDNTEQHSQWPRKSKQTYSWEQVKLKMLLLWRWWSQHLLLLLSSIVVKVLRQWLLPRLVDRVRHAYGYPLFPSWFFFRWCSWRLFVWLCVWRITGGVVSQPSFRVCRDEDKISNVALFCCLSPVHCVNCLPEK